jgi:hypothetical protein
VTSIVAFAPCGSASDWLIWASSVSATWPVLLPYSMTCSTTSDSQDIVPK